MSLITKVHQESCYPNEANIQFALYIVNLFDTMLKTNQPLGLIDDKFVEFLVWLFDRLSNYQLAEKCELYKNDLIHIDRLKSIVEKLNSKTDEYLKVSTKTIYEEMKMIYIEKFIKKLFEKNSNAKWLEVVIYFPQYFQEDNDQLYNCIKNNDKIEKLIFEKIHTIQENSLKKFHTFVVEDKFDFKQLNGYILGSNSTFDKKNPYEVLNFNNLIQTLNNRFTIDGKLSIEIDEFKKIHDCLCCFEDLRIAIERLSTTSQQDWLKVLLVEHIIEKFCLIYSQHDNQIEQLRNVLMGVNEKVLLLFNNMFFSQYIDQMNSDTMPNYQKLKEEKFFRIIELLHVVSPSKKNLDQLSDASLTVWDTLLYEIEFSQIFRREMSKINIEFDERTLLFLNRIRVQLTIENNNRFMEFFQTVSNKIGKEDVKNLDILNNLLEKIHFKRISFEEGNKIVLEVDYSNWSEEIDKLILSNRIVVNQSDAKAADIIRQIKDEQKNKTNVIKADILDQIAIKATVIRDKAWRRIDSNECDTSQIKQEIQNIFNLKDYQDAPSQYVYSHLDEILQLICCAWSIANKPQFPKDTQIVALLLFIHSTDKGLLEQIRTGEGKTLTVGITAAFLALCGHAVDVVSSNRDLAIEGEQKCHSFFQLLKLESGHICNDDDEVNHQAYRPDLKTPQGNIVYGEVGGFQKDILEDEFNNKKIFSDQYKKRNRCLIIDEVDNMCLDRARHVLYLSHEIHSLKHLETLFINIWAAVLRTEIKNLDDMSENIKDISIFIKQNIENRNIFVPVYMEKFVNQKLERWIDSAFQARIMREDDHFVLDIAKTDEQKNQKQKTIIVLDKDTGVEQYSTRWSHGLAQFLELKYRRKLSVESLKAVFISNKAFFQRYNNYLYGLTGTLGSENSQSFLSDLYHVQFVELPTSKKKCFYQLPSKVSFEYSDWLNLIAKESIKQVSKRPVLIICENVESTENIWNELIRHGVSSHTIEKYRRDGDNVEDRFRKKPATKGDIIIATNKGGRGTDIHVDSEVNCEGGMHVVLCYLPDNIRIEEQAFGRTARNGAAGTGQFILQVDKNIYESQYDLSQYPKDQKQKKLEELSDVILEREKITRDNKEAARLSELKLKNILRLEVEEELFDKFNKFKQTIAKDEFKRIFEGKNEKIKEKLIEPFENILKNRWAFWLDEAKDQIDVIETPQQKNALLEKYDSLFIDHITNLLRTSNLSELIDKPEEAIQIGKVYLSENEYSEAKSYFEKAVACGDISGFSHIGIAFCIIQLKPEINIKKESRRRLKKALECLESMKRNLMSNLKIAEILSQSATAEILQKVSSKDNFYQDQIKSKLEVIGTQIHYLTKAIGETVEPYDFILHVNQEEKFDKENYEKGEKLYNLLVDKGIIQGDQIRKSFKRNTIEMEKIIRENLDPSIADRLVDLLKSNKSSFTKNDFQDIVCYDDEIWEVLNVQGKHEKVYILDTHKIKNELGASYENIWNDLEEKIDHTNVNLDVFEENSEKKNFKVYLEQKKILIQTKRVKIEDIDLNLLKSNGKYAKYSKIKFNDNGYEKDKGLKGFLEELFEYIREESKYLYQTDLPYGTREEEGNKIHIFLKEKNILKSGGLAQFKYGNHRDDLSKRLDEIFEKTEYKNDKNLIEPIILRLQGDIRSYEGDLKAHFKEFIDLQEVETVPNELRFFQGIGLDKFLIIQEDKSWWDWNAFAVAMIGVAQVIGGTILIAFGAVNIGGALLAEGVSDMVYATMAGLSGQFSWRDWAIQKSISFSISLVTAGIGKLASVGATVAKIGSVSKAALFFQIAKNAMKQFALTTLTNIITEKIMEQVKDGVIPKILNTIEDQILKVITSSIQTKVETIYSSGKTKEETENEYSTMEKNLEGALSGNHLLPQQFDSIREHVVSALQNSYVNVADALSNSSSKYAKMIGAAVKATFLINQIFGAVQSVLNLASVITTLTNLIENSNQTKTDKNVNQNKSNVEIVKARTEKLINMIKGYITSRLLRELDRVLRQIISKTLTAIGTAIAMGVKAMVDSAYNNNNQIDQLRKSNENRDSQVSVEAPSPKAESEKEKQDEEKRNDLQNNVKNPKDFSEEIENKDRPLGRADIKMLANSESRNIVVYNVDTGEKEVIRPAGLRKIPAFFKQTAEINYKPGEDGSIGHFYTARGTETYKQTNGGNDCLLIAYNESLGRKVNENVIRQERENLYQYTHRHSQQYAEYRQETSRSGYPEMIGGREKREEEEELPPEVIRFSQDNVNKPEHIEEIENRMITDGWEGDPIDVVQMPDEELTSVDNRRVLAAQNAGIKVLAKVHKADDPLPEDQIKRFTVPGLPPPKTWGEAVMIRVQNQPSYWMRVTFPYGTVHRPYVMGRNVDEDKELREWNYDAPYEGMENIGKPQKRKSSKDRK
ncbi:unnamed protein product [Adineta steineri]|uniref:Protein translocase subunit SecA n=1 Tax=Adineta steineri TaxID=433720 RepID=A0A815EJC8_9BILA|nr:unnamed protein product [Adineta steineri]CAF1580890.1 unnamed protein product [Adineta steineri]